MFLSLKSIQKRNSPNEIFVSILLIYPNIGKRKKDNTMHIIRQVELKNPKKEPTTVSIKKTTNKSNIQLNRAKIFFIIFPFIFERYIQRNTVIHFQLTCLWLPVTPFVPYRRLMSGKAFQFFKSDALKCACLHRSFADFCIPFLAFKLSNLITITECA